MHYAKTLIGAGFSLGRNLAANTSELAQGEDAHFKREEHENSLGAGERVPVNLVGNHPGD